MSRWKGIVSRYPRFSVYGICAFVLIALAIGIRIWLTAVGWPLLDSDEGTMGLMGMHIAFRGELPVFFYEQNYMGAAEAYLAAFFFHFFGVSALMLRLGMILLFTLFLIFIYLLTRLLFSKKWALVTLLLLALGSDAILTRELVAVGGDAETLVSGTLVLLLSVWLSLTTSDNISRQRRLLAYAGWGLAAGFGIWSHLLVVPFVLLSAIILLLFCRKEIFNREILKSFSWAVLVLITTFIIGALPLILDNIQHPDQNIFNAFITVHRASNVSNLPSVVQQPFYVLLPSELKGALRISLPTATNASPLCAVTTQPNGVEILGTPLISFSSPYATQCTLVHTFWPLGVIILWMIATTLALYSLKPYWKRFISFEWTTPEEKTLVVRQIGRLALLMASAITFILFILSPKAALYPVATSRYLIGFMITTPALLWPLWSGINAVKPLALRIARVTVAVRLAQISVFLRRGLLLLIAAIFLLGTINTFTGMFPTSQSTSNQDLFTTQVIDLHLNVPDTLAYDKQEGGLLSRLRHLKINRIYSDYWTCDRLIFRTAEKLICAAILPTTTSDFCTAVLASNSPEPADAEARKLSGAEKAKIQGQNRYPHYKQDVQRQPDASYVVQENSTLSNLLDKCTTTSSIVYRKYINTNGYVIYQPTKQRRAIHS